MRTVTHIDVGTHEDKVGYTLHYADGEKEHFLFALPIAEDLAKKLAKVCSDMRYIEQAMDGVPKSRIGVSENITMRMSPPPTEE
jgi:hypothetical protein